MTTKHRKHSRPSAGAGAKRCLVTKESAARADMLRFVVGPDKRLWFDAASKLPGRGMWIQSDRAVLEQAVAKQRFHHEAGKGVFVPADLPDIVERQLRARAMDLLALARKAGLVVLGAASVEKTLGKQPVALGFRASDATGDVFRADDSFPVCTLFSRAELGHVTQHADPAYVAVMPGKLTDALKNAIRRLDLFLKGAKE
ncbi:MAG: DUF448 domain-containing protein [Alphaproteobacteria bacterium]|nr:DUF448 domain-containing protein [Alphaproteobacteria bacterium]